MYGSYSILDRPSMYPFIAFTYHLTRLLGPSLVQSDLEQLANIGRFAESGMSTNTVIWAVSSVFLVSLMSLAGAAILPFIKGKVKRRWFNFFIAMAVATLSADALLHLLPEAIGLHNHGHSHSSSPSTGHGHSHDNHGHHEHSHETSTPSSIVVPNGSHTEGATFPTVPIHDHHHDGSHEGHSTEAADLERGQRSPGLRQKRHVDNGSHEEKHEHEEHEHHHHEEHSSQEGSPQEPHSHKRGWFEYTKDRDMMCKLSCAVVAVIVLYFAELIASGVHLTEHNSKTEYTAMDKSSGMSRGPNVVRDVAGGAPKRASVDSHSTESQRSRISTSSSSEVVMDAPVICCGIRSPAMVILLGDAVHNFVDGIAIGASFAVDNRLGISTSVAVICHELPHELGDMAVLLESGLSMVKALCLNFLSALTAFLGLFVGLASVHFEPVIPWLLAVTAGMFLYVAWVDMLTHLKSNLKREDSWLLTAFLQFCGFFIGFAIIFLIGWFEEELAGHEH